MVLLLIVKITPGELGLHQYSAVASICKYGALKSIEIIKKVIIDYDKKPEFMTDQSWCHLA